MTSNIAYDKDFYAWAKQNAALIRDGRLAAIDLEHIAEELETLGRSEKRELMNRLAVLIGHLLKWQLQPERRSNSWRKTIEVQRLDTRQVLDDNLSLKSEIPTILPNAYRKARLLAMNETGLARDSFPENCPYVLEQALNNDFWPEEQ